MAATKTSDETSQATIAGAHMRGINSTPADRKFPGYAFWGEKGADVASAGTLVLGDDGDYFHITGTTTITDIDFNTAKDGRRATLIFDGALTLTHNATTLNLPGGVNIVTAAGDRALVVQDSGDNIHVLDYVRAAALPNRSRIDTAQATTSGTSKSFTIPEGCVEFTLAMHAVSTNGTSSLRVRIGPVGGVETSGYVGATTTAAASVVQTAGFSAGIDFNDAGASGASRSGRLTFTLVDPATNTWSFDGSIGDPVSTPRTSFVAGSKPLAGVLSIVTLTTVNGTDTLDAGLSNVKISG